MIALSSWLVFVAACVMTGLLNPKVALFQLAPFPQFIDPFGHVLAQSLLLGATELVIVAVCVVGATVLRPVATPGTAFSRWSRRMLAGVFAALALRLVLERK